jgi:predicted ATPase
MKTSNIKSFKIKGLFGDRDVNIPFKQDIKILIGENGLGKTTVLNMLYFILSNKLYKLRDFDFKTLELSFQDGQVISLEREKLIGIDDSLDPSPPEVLINEILRAFTSRDLEEINQLFLKQVPRSYILDRFYHRNDIFHRYPASMVISALKAICGYGDKDNKIKNAKETLQKELIDTEVLYFPTYRRIEEDLINLGIEDEKSKLGQADTRIIQFGMKDVKERLDEIKKEINNLSSRGLSTISSEILSQLVKGVPHINKNTLQTISKKDIDIILARVGEAISKEDKQKITNIVAEKKLKDLDDKYLVYFLQKLINIYDQQREIDNSIENFVSVCNKYLVLSEKEIQYEASEVDFYFIFKTSGRKVLLSNLLSKLSSGEKQIISLFSRIYLSKGKNFIVLFDEPELSLSLFWQKLLLPDIIASKKCKLLLSVTHSPFIFENNLEKFAIGLNQYIKLY